MGWKMEQLGESLQSRIQKQIHEDNQARLSRSSPKLQEQQAPVQGKANNKARESKDNAGYDSAVPKTVIINSFIHDKRRRDLDGILATIMDCLVHAKALADDNRFCVPRIEIESFDCEKGKDRVEIEIKEYVKRQDY